MSRLSDQETCVSVIESKLNDLTNNMHTILHLTPSTEDRQPSASSDMANHLHQSQQSGSSQEINAPEATGHGS
jgi:hypothetical protein